MLETPLDNVEPYQLFRASLLSISPSSRIFLTGTPADCPILELQSDQPTLYASLTKVLDVHDQQILTSVFHEAENQEARMREQQAQAAQAAAGQQLAAGQVLGQPQGTVAAQPPLAAVIPPGPNTPTTMPGMPGAGGVGAGGGVGVNGQ